MKKPFKPTRKHDRFLATTKIPANAPRLSLHEYRSNPPALVVTSSPCVSANSSFCSSQSRMFKTVNPNCIFNPPLSFSTIPTDLLEGEKINKEMLPDDSVQEIHSGSHTDTSKPDADSFFETKNHMDDIYDPTLIIDTLDYQQYLYFNQNDSQIHSDNDKLIDSPYANEFQNETFNNSTSYELDSNLTPQLFIHNDENINPIFFHETPSPSDPHSIRIVTSSNRIVRLRDKKILNAIHRILDSPKKHTHLPTQQLTSSDCFKRINDNQQNCDDTHSSPRKDINDSLIKAINHNTNLFPAKNTFINDHAIANEFLKDIDEENSNEEVEEDEEEEKSTVDDQISNFGRTPIFFKSAIDTPINDESFSKHTEDEATHSDSPEENNQNQFVFKLKKTANKTTIISTRRNRKVRRVKYQKTRASRLRSQTKRENTRHELQTSIQPTITTETPPAPESKVKAEAEATEDAKKDTISEVEKAAIEFAEQQTAAEIKRDVVMHLFRESMKKNKDQMHRTKPKDKTGVQVPKITKVKVKIPKPHPTSLETFEEKDIYKCVQCSKVFKQRSQWKRHVDCIHLKIAKFTCIKCSKRFKRSDHLKNHIRRIHGGP